MKIKYPNLLAEMARKGEKQKDLAKLLKLNESGISRRLSGEIEWTISEIELVCGHYDKEYCQLFK